MKSQSFSETKSSLFLLLHFMLAVCLSANLQLKTDLKYNLSYSLKGATHGHILLIIPFRVYYESFASMNLNANKSPDGSFEFFFSDIPVTGYMMRTSGFLGKTLVILAAHYDLGKALALARRKLRNFDIPYYSRFIKRRKPFLFKIYSRDKDSFRFTRYYGGIHAHFNLDFLVRYKYHPEILNIDFNIYKILCEMSKAYNHSFLPKSGLKQLLIDPNHQWKSPPLDFSGNINAVVRTAARIMRRIKRFNQERSFILTYRMTSLTEDFIEIKGSDRPDVKIWGKYGITRFTRNVKLRRKDGIVVHDSLFIEIENPDKRGLEACVTLSKLD